MTDGGPAFQPGQGDAPVPARPRSAFVAHEVFGHGAGAVLVEPDVARDLRTAAESASAEQRVSGGLLYGHPWTDDEGPYLVVDGFLEAGPGENSGDRAPADGRDSFALSEADLRLLREDAARMYSAALEVGWWRSVPGPGEFGPRDFVSQRELVGPGGVGLLVFGTGLDWGTAYLGPDGQVPGSARSFIPVPRPATDPPRPRPPGLSLIPGDAPEQDEAPEQDGPEQDGPEQDGTAEPDEAPEQREVPEGGAAGGQAVSVAAEPAGAAAPGTTLAIRRQPVLTPAPQPLAPAVISPVRVPAKEWGGAKATTATIVGPKTPTDVKVVIAALGGAAIIAAIMLGVMLSSLLVFVIVTVVLLLALTGFLWMSRL